MNRKLKALGTFVAALAFSAVAVSAASADTVLKTTNKNSIVTGQQIEHPGGNVFKTVNGDYFSCEQVTYTGTAVSPDNVSPFAIYEATVHPTYSGCAAQGVGAVTITTKGCDFTLTDTTSAGGDNIIHLVCNTGAAIEVHIPSIDCVLKMAPQTPEGGLVYTNTEESNPDDVDATFTLSGVTYTKLRTSTGGAPNPLCNAVGNGSDGQWLTRMTFRAYEDVEFSGNLTDETYSVTEGSQLPLTVENPDAPPSAIITGEQIEHPGGNKFTTSNGEITCSKVTYTGTVETGGGEPPVALDEATVHPTYSECTAKGLGAATITTKGCDFTLTDETTGPHKIVHLVCNTGAKLIAHIPSVDCQIEIAPQTPEGGLVYTNTEESNPDDVDATLTLLGVTYTKKKTSTGGAPGVLCNAIGNGSDGQWLTRMTLRAYEDLKFTGDLTDETYKVTEGSQVSLTVENIPNAP
jgi:hypothetical protein